MFETNETNETRKSEMWAVRSITCGEIWVTLEAELTRLEYYVDSILMCNVHSDVRVLRTAMRVLRGRFEMGFMTIEELDLGLHNLSRALGED